MKASVYCGVRRHALAAAVALCLSTNGQAADIAVNDAGAGSVAGACTLFDAVAAVNNQIAVNGCIAGNGSNDTIDLTGFTTATTVTFIASSGNNAALALTKPATIKGALDAAGNPLVTLQRSSAAGTPSFGLIYAGANLVVDGLALRNGNAVKGGAIQASTFTSVALSNAVVSGNAASGNGGGIYTNAGNITLAHVVISGNTAGNHGGGVYAVPGTISVDNSTISGNSAKQGGGICTNNGNITLTSSTISGNTASGNGGGVYTNAGSVQIGYSTVSGNSAVGNGGGIRTSNGQIYLSHSTVSANSANAAGGGVSLFANSVQATYSTLNGNSAATHGGAIYAGQSASAALTNSTVSGNSAGQSGGGIYANTATVSYSTVYANQSTTSGSKGAGLYFVNGATANASIITGNIGFDDIDAKNGGALSGNYNIVGSSGISTPADDINCASGIHLGPLANFGGSTKTLPLLSGSCAIDTASASPTVAKDQRGLARPATINLPRADVGAFEKQNASDPDYIFIDGFGPTGSD